MDRFKFRIPVYDNKNKFVGFTNLDIEKGIAPYNYGKVHHEEKEQCIGLKDKNGNLIYEGDILKNNFTTAMYEVVFRNAGFYFRLYFKRYNEIIDYLPPDRNFASITEIIGNIHENKDLLEANND